MRRTNDTKGSEGNPWSRGGSIGKRNERERGAVEFVGRERGHMRVGRKEQGNTNETARETRNTGRYETLKGQWKRPRNRGKSVGWMRHRGKLIGRKKNTEGSLGRTKNTQALVRKKL